MKGDFIIGHCHIVRWPYLPWCRVTGRVLLAPAKPLPRPAKFAAHRVARKAK